MWLHEADARAAFSWTNNRIGLIYQFAAAAIGAADASLYDHHREGP
jgi:hypothetical protein